MKGHLGSFHSTGTCTCTYMFLLLYYVLVILTLCSEDAFDVMCVHLFSCQAIGAPECAACKYLLLTCFNLHHPCVFIYTVPSLLPV